MAIDNRSHTAPRQIAKVGNFVRASLGGRLGEIIEVDAASPSNFRVRFDSGVESDIRNGLGVILMQDGWKP